MIPAPIAIRLAIAGALIVGGIGISIMGKRRKPAKADSPAPDRGSKTEVHNHFHSDGSKFDPNQKKAEAAEKEKAEKEAAEKEKAEKEAAEKAKKEAEAKNKKDD